MVLYGAKCGLAPSLRLLSKDLGNCWITLAHVYDKHKIPYYYTINNA